PCARVPSRARAPPCRRAPRRGRRGPRPRGSSRLRGRTRSRRRPARAPRDRDRGPCPRPVPRRARVVRTAAHHTPPPTTRGLCRGGAGVAARGARALRGSLGGFGEDVAGQTTVAAPHCRTSLVGTRVVRGPQIPSAAVVI